MDDNEGLPELHKGDHRWDTAAIEYLTGVGISPDSLACFATSKQEHQESVVQKYGLNLALFRILRQQGDCAVTAIYKCFLDKGNRR
jgi:hypothetical protein